MDAAIDIRGLSVTFPTPSGPVYAVRDLTLSIAPGTVFGFLGPNGAGKTTTLLALLGFLKPSSGQAFIFGQEVAATIARERIGYLAENPDTYAFLTGRELLVLTGRLFHLAPSLNRERAARLLGEMGLTQAADRRIAGYSRGMRQRICIAQSLMNDPDLLVLDEPTGGMDPLGRMEIRRLIGERRAAGKTVFFSSHELSEVELVCDKVALIAGGRLLAVGRTADLVAPGESLERFFVSRVQAESQLARAAG